MLLCYSDTLYVGSNLSYSSKPCVRLSILTIQNFSSGAAVIMVITKSKLVLGATAVTLSTIAITSLGIHSRGQALNNSPKELIDEVWQVVQRQYVDGTFNQVDWQAVRKEYLNKNYSSKKEAYKSIREMLKKLDDPYTRFMDPDEFKNMQVDTSGELTGIGITISQDEKTKQLVVIAPIEDTPAFKAGILSKDEILNIDGKSTKGMDTNQAVFAGLDKPKILKSNAQGLKFIRSNSPKNKPHPAMLATFV
jgi:carboxyl-terminal processing protease